MRISQLEGKRVALWGWGREGRAAYHALRDREWGIVSGDSQERFPARLTVLCSAAEAEEILALGDAHLRVETEFSGELLASFDVVIKSPGISPYKPEAQHAMAQGTQFIGGTSLWFSEHADADGTLPNTVCVTGTKGKSTSTLR